MVAGRVRVLVHALALFSSLVGAAADAAGSLEVETSGAKLTRTKVPATGRQESLLEVQRFGRFALTVESKQGTALQVISKMAGPGPVSGAAGEANGRIDGFYDRGTY